MSHNPWEARLTALTVEAATGLRRLAQPICAGDKVKAQIARAARKAGLSYWRAFDLWYGKARRIDAAELEGIRVAQLKRSSEEADARTEIAFLKCRLAELESRIARQGAASAPGLPAVGSPMAARGSRVAD